MDTLRRIVGRLVRLPFQVLGVLMRGGMPAARRPAPRQKPAAATKGEKAGKSR